jgi:hypothetical protein
MSKIKDRKAQGKRAGSTGLEQGAGTERTQRAGHRAWSMGKGRKNYRHGAERIAKINNRKAQVARGRSIEKTTKRQIFSKINILTKRSK